MNKDKRKKYIDTIIYYQDILRIIRDYNENYFYINDYDIYFQDILTYEDNDFQDFKTEKDFQSFIDELKKIIISGL